VKRKNESMLVAGVDEAGRGACLGPLTVGVTVFDKRDEEALLDMGIKDSKLLTQEKRLELMPQVQKLAKEWNFSHVFPEELNLLMNRKSLNEIEAMRMGLLLNNLERKPDMIIVDACDPVAESFTRRLKKYISFKTVIKSEHKADLNHPIVGAASIIAKVNRDLEIENLAKEHGELGCGYSHDEKTIAFIEKYLEKHDKLPVFARSHWSTTQRLEQKRFQQKLF
jgi:ribonuclease HII